ncbi:MAG: 16S rRNA (cytosine(1402)-N(4))-methyltransferase RsmH [Bacteroidales bacterium]
MPTHEPVMTAEVLELLRPSRSGVFVDCTLGAAGHAEALLEAGASRLLGIDRDPSAIAGARARLARWGDRVELIHADYRALADVLDARGIAAVDGILADLGLSSMQIEGEGRGFSFQRDEPLDMRMDTSQGPTAAELIARVSEQDLARVIFEYGEERHARRVARSIVTARDAGPITTTGTLAAIARRAAGGRGWQRIDPATRTFQAIRIWVNEELQGLDRFIADACERLRPGGRLAAITFHSLEDRVVKHTLRGLAQSPGSAIRVLTKKPVRPGDDEVARNPRARSAKLRAAEREAA